MIRVLSPMDKAPPRGRVLIAEDDEITGHICARTLSEAGYDVTIAEDGVRALEMLSEGGYDLLITDAMMPQMDGFELVRTLRNDYDLRKIPVMFLTACDQSEALSRGFRVGADRFLVKPIRPIELIEEVDSLLMKAVGTVAQISLAALSGRLDAISVVAVLAFLHTQEASGILRLSRFGATGHIIVRDGQPIDARVDRALLHEDALATLLGWNAGSFRFEPADVSSVKAAFSEPFSELLLHADRRRRAP
jgi:CheY-like chemotaxis protein